MFVNLRVLRNPEVPCTTVINWYKASGFIGLFNTKEHDIIHWLYEGRYSVKAVLKTMLLQIRSNRIDVCQTK